MKNVSDLQQTISPKMCPLKKNENGLTKKKLWSKILLNREFCIGKGDKPKILNFEFWQCYQVDYEYFTSDIKVNHDSNMTL